MFCLSICLFTSFTAHVISTTTYYLEEKGKIGIDHILSRATLSCTEDCIIFCNGEKALTANYDVTTGTCVCHSVFPEMLSLMTQANNFMYTNQACAAAAGFGYVYDISSNFCYKVHTKKTIWMEAREECKKEGGDLAKLDTPEKRQLVREIIKADGANEYFLGATDMAEDGVWRWVVDDTVFPEYTKKGLSECLEMQSDLRLDDTGCTHQDQKYICDISLL
ncbi:uncharacterized protein LOC124144367 [Haliotis rufescens]|uniref:uncharacterized protein LOC124144367 n=1 Tax=Haliotis rufescens TaxID=6454 RepID=UPI00201EEB56|nr:uncharacterized protein LOC124144367 [Haliotis rufescens]